MKVIGIILLVFGILSFIGGILRPSGADASVVAFGYAFKIALIIGGIALISKGNNNKKQA